MSIQIRSIANDELEEMLAQHKELNPDREIRDDIKCALDKYAQSGWDPGGFLMAVLENDLFGALGKADSYNRATIYQITSYIYNELPCTCWGSPKIVQSHLDKFQSSEDVKS